MDNSLIGKITIPKTDSWQSWKSVPIIGTIPTGTHFLRPEAVANNENADFLCNINYGDFAYSNENLSTSVLNNESEDISIFPVPAANFITINSTGWDYQKVVIFDIRGKVVYSKTG